MNKAKDQIKAMNFDNPDYIPVRVSLLPATWKKYRNKLDQLVARHPIIFGENPQKRDYDDIRGTYTKGEHVDAWGCVWSNLKEGMEAMVTGHPVASREDVHDLEPPQEDIGFPHGFMYLRLADLRGYENLMMDFAEEPPELKKLIDIVLNYNIQQLEKLLASEPEGEILYFGDDLGMQNSLPISPQKWRKYMKPCYDKLYGMCQEAGYSVYMHTDGHILEIIPDLKECGVDVINPQVRANGLDNLKEVCKGKICVDLDLDRQLFPFCSPEDIEEHVREAVEKLGSPEGGLWLIAECAPDVPLENIEAICNALEKYRGYYREQ
ncbi:MAG: uroporphyrinogen decarboxylase family protein [Bacillota bacterium]